MPRLNAVRPTLASALQLAFLLEVINHGPTDHGAKVVWGTVQQRTLPARRVAVQDHALSDVERRSLLPNRCAGPGQCCSDAWTPTTGRTP